METIQKRTDIFANFDQDGYCAKKAVKDLEVGLTHLKSAIWHLEHGRMNAANSSMSLEDFSVLADLVGDVKDLKNRLIDALEMVRSQAE